MPAMIDVSNGPRNPPYANSCSVEKIEWTVGFALSAMACASNGPLYPPYACCWNQLGFGAAIDLSGKGSFTPQPNLVSLERVYAREVKTPTGTVRESLNPTSSRKLGT